MRRHAGSLGVQEYCCEALASLADGNAENKGKIGAQGGIKVITDGMQKHKDDSSVQRKGQAALRVLTDVARQAAASSAASAVSAGAAGKRSRLEALWLRPRRLRAPQRSLASSAASAPALSAGAGAAAGSHRSGNAETDRKVRIMCVGAG
jgi:hypothetical protein